MTLSGPLSAVVTVLFLASTAGSVVAFYRATLAKSTIEGLRGDRDDLIARVGLQDAEIARITARMASSEAENATLRTLKDSSDAVEKLAERLVAADRARGGEHHDIIAAIQTVPAVVTAGHDEIMALFRATSHTHGSAA